MPNFYASFDYRIAYNGEQYFAATVWYDDSGAVTFWRKHELMVWEDVADLHYEIAALYKATGKPVLTVNEEAA